ncbi:hypothetical protein C5167_038525 [Papaver somniferum]|uniref:Uncharacterized protein n=1 Tax=Papaver somniferum TaxID=3469 RepID=A0A4Y7IDR2_PAPSO|nr:hypothetical protein C5167_038525 [Papaver somniferum]
MNRAWVGLAETLEGSIMVITESNGSKLIGFVTPRREHPNPCKLDGAIDPVIIRGSYEPNEEVGELDKMIPAYTSDIFQGGKPHSVPSISINLVINDALNCAAVRFNSQKHQVNLNSDLVVILQQVHLNSFAVQILIRKL